MTLACAAAGTLLTGVEVVMESRRILTDKFGATASDLIPVNTVMESAEFVAGNIVSAEISDPDDRPIIAAALGGRSNLFVTGDYALLTLERIDTMELLAPRALYERLIAG